IWTDYFREDLKEKNIQKLPELVKRPKTNKKEVWKRLVRASSSAQPTEEKKEEEEICLYFICMQSTVVTHIIISMCLCGYYKSRKFSRHNMQYLLCMYASIRFACRGCQ